MNAGADGVARRSASASTRACPAARCGLAPSLGHVRAAELGRPGGGSGCGARARARRPAVRSRRTCPAMNRWHRVWNTQPDGGFAGLGISPASRMRRDGSPSTLGTADSSASVYGWWGPSKICVGAADLLHPPEVHHDDAVGEVAHDAEVVADEQVARRLGRLQLGEQVEDRRLHRHVEGARRLVADDDARIAGERPGDRDALLQPARQLARAACRGAGATAATPRPSSRPGPRRPCPLTPVSLCTDRLRMRRTLQLRLSAESGFWNTICIGPHGRRRRGRSALRGNGWSSRLISLPSSGA